MKQTALPMDGLPANVLLESAHYLGPSRRARFTYQDELGVLVFASPTARHVCGDWLELVRWCITGGKNSGSRQWAEARRWLMERSDTTTVISYSDPSVGHTGALYRACGWLWAPTWHRLFPPPTGHGAWSDGQGQSVKDRWVSLLRPDAEREARLAVDDGRIKRMPWAEYREPRWKRGKPQLHTGGGNYERWVTEQAA